MQRYQFTYHRRYARFSVSVDMDQGSSIAALVVIVFKEKVMKIIKFDIKKYLISEKNLQNNFCIVLAVLCLGLFSGGCQIKDKYNEILETHRAVKLFEENIWWPRYTRDYDEYTDRIKSKTTFVTINVYGELSEEDMLEIMDYYEFTRNANFGTGTRYLGEHDTDFTCYAVFFEGESDKEILRIKYFNGKEVTPTEEEEPMFPSAIMRSRLRTQLP